MDTRRIFDALAGQGPEVAWIREKDVRRTKSTLTAITVTYLFLIPWFAFKPRLYEGTSPLEVSPNPIGLGAAILSFALLTVMTVNIGRPLLIRWPPLELFFWYILTILVGISTYSVALAKVGGADLLHSARSVQELGGLEKFIVSKPTEAAVIAWTSAACTGLAMTATLRGLTFPPLQYALFLIICIFTATSDDPAFSLNRSAVVFLCILGLTLFSINRNRYNCGADTYHDQSAEDDEEAQRRTLLTSLIGGEVHDRLRRKERVADSFSNLTVMFADMVGFTALSRRVSPGHLVDLLNELFAAGDEIAAAQGMEKVKTIGDCYMAVTGGIASANLGPADAIRFAQLYLQKVGEISTKLEIPLGLRVGIHTGPAVGGIIGVSRPSYDYWGDTVNLASRLEGASASGRILVSESTWLQTKRDFKFDDGRDVELKGAGLVQCHFLALGSQSGENVLPLRPAMPG